MSAFRITVEDLNGGEFSFVLSQSVMDDPAQLHFVMTKMLAKAKEAGRSPESYLTFAVVGRLEDGSPILKKRKVKR